MALTLRAFIRLTDEMGTIAKMEHGVDSTEQPLTGEAGFAVAQTMFKRGRKK